MKAALLCLSRGQACRFNFLLLMGDKGKKIIALFLFSVLKSVLFCLFVGGLGFFLLMQGSQSDLLDTGGKLQLTSVTSLQSLCSYSSETESRITPNINLHSCGRAVHCGIPTHGVSSHSLPVFQFLPCPTISMSVLGPQRHEIWCFVFIPPSAYFHTCKTGLIPDRPNSVTVLFNNKPQ